MRTEQNGAVASLIIDNPERRNAMNADMYRQVPAAVDEITSNPEIRCVVLRGTGSEAFGAGSDISEFPTRRTGDEAGRFDSSEHRAWKAIAAIPVPVIAAIHGSCMGGAVAIALHADIRIAADDARFAVPPARLGLAYPPPAVDRLVQLVGPSMTKLLLFSARVIDAEEAHRIGLADEVVPKHELDNHVADLATQITTLSPLSIRAAKLSVEAIHREDLRVDTNDAISECYASADFREGVKAFMEKRKPVFEGH